MSTEVSKRHSIISVRKDKIHKAVDGKVNKMNEERSQGQILFKWELNENPKQTFRQLEQEENRTDGKPTFCVKRKGAINYKQ